MVLLLFSAYELFGKTFEINAEQNQLDSTLDQQWAAPGSPAAGAGADAIPGKGIARLYIPRLKDHWVVVEGVEPADIKLAPGHYPPHEMPGYVPKAEQPGQLGNFSVAGHRVVSIFRYLNNVRENDAIIVETRTTWFIYRVEKDPFVVSPRQTSVVAANPDNPGAKPVRKLLTLTTCEPWWDNYNRLIVRAEMVRQQPKSAGRPKELQGS